MLNNVNIQQQNDDELVVLNPVPLLFKHTPCIINVEELTTKTKLQTLIDTGSALNLIQRKAFDKIQRARTLLQLEPISISTTYNNHAICGVDGVPFKATGCVKLRITIGTHSMSTDYLIVETFNSILRIHRQISSSGILLLTDDTINLTTTEDITSQNNHPGIRNPFPEEQLFPLPLHLTPLNILDHSQ